MKRFVPNWCTGLLVCAIGFGCQQQHESPALAAAPSVESTQPSQPETTESSDQLAQATTGKSNKAPAKAAPKGPAADLPGNPFPQRIPAPELSGGVGWINTGGPIELRQLRGKFVILDFWTYCCINCMHILPELKKLEHKYPQQLVVIGVHSAKFETEQDTKNITDAVLRYEIEHPVVNDAEHKIWNRYGVNSWPTLLLIDPEGYAVYMKGGETTFDKLDEIFKVAVPYYRKKGTLDETPLRFDLAAFKAEPTPLRFPGKVIADEPGSRLFIADSNHNRIVVSSLDGKLVETIGSGAIGAADGDFEKCSFNKPQGMVLHGTDTLYVADTENHLLRKIDLKAKKVVTIAGTGEQSRQNWPGLDRVTNLENFRIPDRWVGKPRVTAINSPWDLWINGQNLYIAMAGPHQIWRMPLDEHEIGPFAGNGREDIVDGPLLPKEPYAMGFSSFAQPSGLTSDGKHLFIADSEGSSIRSMPFDPRGEVSTVIGTAHLNGARLFTFGDVDGQGDNALLQHALGVAWHDGKIYVADTYNNKVKVIDVAKRTLKTIAGSGKPGTTDEPALFDEPAGITYAGGKLYVADTNNHLIRTVDLSNNKVATLTIAGLTPPKVEAAEPPNATAPAGDEIAIDAPPVKRTDEAVTIDVQLQLPSGWKINALAPMRYKVEPIADAGPIRRSTLGKAVKVEPPAASFKVSLPADAAEGTDRLRLSLNYYYCQDGAEGVCKTGTAVWNVSLKLSSGATATSVPITLKVE